MNRRRGSRPKNNRRRLFGIVLNDIETGEVIHPEERMGPKKYLKKLIEKLNQFNNNIKTRRVFISMGAFMVILFVLMYNYIFIAEYISILYTYIIGSMVVSNAIKDEVVNAVAKVKDKFLSRDKELEELKVTFSNLKRTGFVDLDTELYFKNLLNNHETLKNTQAKQTIKSFMKLIINLNKNYPEEMNSPIDEDTIDNIVYNLNGFLEEYKEAKIELDNKLVNPLLLSMLGKESRPINAVYLLGNHGVGKTRFVKNLASNVGAAIYEYTMDDDTKLITSTEYMEDQYNKLSVFIRMILENTANQPAILYIRDFAKKSGKLFDVFFDLLVKKKIYNTQLGITIRIPKNLIVVCASDKSLEDIIYEDNRYTDLANRFTEVIIPDMTKEIQLITILNHVNDIYPDMDDADMEYFRNVVYKTNYSGIKELIDISNEYIQHINSIEDLKRYKNVQNKQVYAQEYLSRLDNDIYERV